MFYDIAKKIADKTQPGNFKSTDMAVKNPRGKSLVTKEEDERPKKKSCC